MRHPADTIIIDKLLVVFGLCPSTAETLAVEAAVVVIIVVVLLKAVVRAGPSLPACPLVDTIIKRSSPIFIKHEVFRFVKFGDQNHGSTANPRLGN